MAPAGPEDGFGPAAPWRLYAAALRGSAAALQRLRTASARSSELLSPGRQIGHGCDHREDTVSKAGKEACTRERARRRGDAASAHRRGAGGPRPPDGTRPQPGPRVAAGGARDHRRGRGRLSAAARCASISSGTTTVWRLPTVRRRCGSFQALGQPGDSRPRPPGFDGADVLAKIRRHSSIPVIVCSGHDSEDDRIRTLIWEPTTSSSSRSPLPSSRRGWGRSAPRQRRAGSGLHPPRRSHHRPRHAYRDRA